LCAVVIIVHDDDSGGTKNNRQTKKSSSFPWYGVSVLDKSKLGHRPTDHGQKVSGYARTIWRINGRHGVATHQICIHPGGRGTRICNLGDCNTRRHSENGQDLCQTDWTRWPPTHISATT
jgi:hypothetical protein